MSAKHKSSSELGVGQIGDELIGYANLHGEPTRLPVTTLYFPYLLVASRKLTTRQMSFFLEANFGVKLSAVSIAKGLKQPQRHLKRLADHVLSHANYLAALSGRSAEALLFFTHPRTDVTELQELEEEWSHDPEGNSPDVQEAFDLLREIWTPMPQEVKYMCRPHFDFESSTVDADEAEEESPE